MIRTPTRLVIAGLMVLLVTAGLAIVEAVARIRGIEPWAAIASERRDPAIHEPDTVLGWRNLPGLHVIRGYSEGAPDIRFTFRGDGSRATSAAPTQRLNPELIVLGGSFTQGWAISDEETFAWKLQQRFPGLRVSNYGTAGYGTYQSLLVLEGILAERSPAAVLYGFVPVHAHRNVAHPGWLRALGRNTGQGYAALPFCSLDRSGALVRHAPITYSNWPLREQLATAAALEYGVAMLRARTRTRQAQEVTTRLMAEMAEASADRGAAFGVVMLLGESVEREPYQTFLASRGIPFAACPMPVERDLIVDGEGHPNGRANDRWARCMAPLVARLVR